VQREFDISKGCGARNLRHRLKHNYTGVTEKELKKTLIRSEEYKKTFPRFKNKSVLTPVKAEDVGHKWQMDLVGMTLESINSENQTYNFILSIVDVFPRFVILRPFAEQNK